MTKKERKALADRLVNLAADIAEMAGFLEGSEAPETGKPAKAQDSAPETPATEPEAQSAEPLAEQPAPVPTKVCTFEEARSILAEKARNGFRAEVKALLAKRGVEQLSDIKDPAELAALVAEAEAFTL